jgi:hypothetical protein
MPLPEGYSLAEILAQGNSRADPDPIPEGSSGAAAAAATDLQGVVTFPVVRLEQGRRFQIW